MIKYSPILLIGIAIFLWARGMRTEDTFTLGLGKGGRLELRSAAASVSVSASPALHKLGKIASMELNSRKINADSSNHRGFHAQWRAMNDWTLRIPLLAVMALVIFALIVLMKRVKQR
jgi:hypothetical protein